MMQINSRSLLVIKWSVTYLCTLVDPLDGSDKRFESSDKRLYRYGHLLLMMNLLFYLFDDFVSYTMRWYGLDWIVLLTATILFIVALFNLIFSSRFTFIRLFFSMSCLLLYSSVLHI
jgi:hypothetical protein